jgi:hypothetical protein
MQLQRVAGMFSGRAGGQSCAAGVTFRGMMLGRGTG